MVAKKGEGTFSEVFKAQCVKNGKMAAIKFMKSTFESEEQVNSLREIQALRRLSPHPGVIKLIEVLYEEVCTVQHETNLLNLRSPSVEATPAPSPSLRQRALACSLLTQGSSRRGGWRLSSNSWT